MVTTWQRQSVPFTIAVMLAHSRFSCTCKGGRPQQQGWTGCTRGDRCARSVWIRTAIPVLPHTAQGPRSVHASSSTWNSASPHTGCVLSEAARLGEFRGSARAVVTALSQSDSCVRVTGEHVRAVSESELLTRRGGTGVGSGDLASEANAAPVETPHDAGHAQHPGTLLSPPVRRALRP